MKCKIFIGFLLLVTVTGYATLIAQEDMVDRVSVKLSDPSKPCFIECGLVNGGITVIGYDGQEVIVEATTHTKKYSKNDENDKTKGMFRIPVNSTSLEVEEHHNRIDISTASWKRTTDVSVKVPKQTSLNLSCVNKGDIYVENVSGELEVNNVNGAVTLKDVGGSVVAHALNKKLEVNLLEITPDKPMSFSTMNGDVDVTFPATLKANVKIKADQGDVYSDFEIQKLDKSRQVIEENGRDEEGKYRISIENAFYGTINGGGPEFQFTSWQGDILIRKAN